TQDKLIPLLHPYLEIVQHEFHHRKRYDAYPRLGVIVGEENGTDETDLEIIHDIYKRFALNFRTELVFMKVCSQPIEEVTHAIDAL
ncbi:hypothetical protein JXJ21_00705, partial [candidate division KSB1 bacterium]|nr:hypothetical protein [candidate division KSB1 bacterium]